MKPKNKFQQRVFELSQKLPSITKAQEKWAFQHCFEHIGRRTPKGVITCMDCGHRWTDTTTQKRCHCPNCNAKLLITDTRKRVFRDYQYFCIVTTCKGFQVLRFFFIRYYAKTGEKAYYFISEVVQRWIAPNGQHTTIARLRPMSYYEDIWNFRSSLELRPERSHHNIFTTCIYPRQKLIPEMKRSGYKGKCYGLTPFNLFHTLLTESRAETLLKAGAISLLQFFTSRGFYDIHNYWSSIKICLRNAYKIKDVSMWCDYIDLLDFFDKDLHNAKYVCPADLKVEHDKYVKKKRQWQEKERNAEARRKVLEDEAHFKEMKSKFFGLQFTDGLIEVRVLVSVKEIMQEGDVLHHCVFASDYHLKPDSLILSACVNGKKVETIEFSLSKMQVIQSRGACNKNTKYHERIIELVKKNRRKIRQRMAA